jgi:hypothetical protein
MRTHGSEKSAKIDAAPSAVPDVLAPGLEVVLRSIHLFPTSGSVPGTSP